MSLPVLLFILFLVLKLVGVIAWSWVWVTAPLWAGLAAAMVAWAFALMFGASFMFLGNRWIKKRLDRF